MHINLFNFSAQVVHVLIYSLENQYSFTTTFVYGFNTISARKALWDDLQWWSPNSPWLVLETLILCFHRMTNTMELISPAMKFQTLRNVVLIWVFLI